MASQLSRLTKNRQLWIKCLHFFTKIKGGTGFGPPTVVYCFLICRSIRFLLIETNHVHARNHITIFPIPQRFCMSEPSPSKTTPTNPLDHNSCVEKALEKVKIGFAYPLLSMLWCSKPLHFCWYTNLLALLGFWDTNIRHFSLTSAIQKGQLH